MSKLTQTPANRRKIAQAKRALDALFDLALTRGFYGTVAIEMVLHDGTIQKIRSRVEWDEK
ncbi:unnamed protein product [marine sediment metagenome]|uniref:Uncharacterized protein n=1 Tax=marine sediment metagenome TaxID=412755 RepID=X0WPH3_9ZZZZ